MTVASMGAELTIVSSSEVLASASDNTAPPLKRVPYIYYPLYFKKDQVKSQALINSDSKFNTITWSYATKLGLKIRTINVRVQKIDGSTFETFDIVLASFQVKDKFERARFFREIFLMTDTSIDIIIRILFFILNNINMVFKD